MVRDLGRFDPTLAADPPLREVLHSFLDQGSFIFPALTDDVLILLDTLDHGIVRLFVHLYVSEIVPLLVRGVALDHRVIDNRRRTVVIDDGGRVYVGHPYIPVIAHTVEILLRDHNGPVYVSIIPKVDADSWQIGVWL